MKTCFAVGATLAIAVLACTAFAADGLKSGPQAGADCSTPFEPKNVTGPFAGTARCLV